MSNILLSATHVIFGVASLAGGLTAILARKSKGLHTRAGMLYTIGMYGTGITGVVMSVIRFNPFLLSVGLFALYLTYSGKVSIDLFRRKETWNPDWKQLAPAVMAIAVAAFMILWPMSQMLISGTFFVPVLAVFGLILMLNAIQDFRLLSGKANLYPRNRNFLVAHIGKMGGAYISTLTAFLVNNVSTDPAWVSWLLPTLVGTPLIVLSIRNWKSKLRMA